MTDFIFSTVWGWIGTAGIIVIAGLVVGYLIPQTRIYVIGIIGVAISLATIYTKATRDERARQQRLKDEAVNDAQNKYRKIDSRPDDPGTVADRLRNNNF